MDVSSTSCLRNSLALASIISVWTKSLSVSWRARSIRKGSRQVIDRLPRVEVVFSYGAACSINRDQARPTWLCVSTGGGLQEQILLDCHNEPLGGHFGRQKTDLMVRRLAFGVG